MTQLLHPFRTHLQLVDVLRTRNNKAPLFQSSHIKADEVKDGTFEEIILDMKKKPFRAEQNGNGPAGEHMRKSFREESTVNGRVCLLLTLEQYLKNK